LGEDPNTSANTLALSPTSFASSSLTIEGTESLTDFNLLSSTSNTTVSLGSLLFAADVSPNVFLTNAVVGVQGGLSFLKLGFAGNTNSATVGLSVTNGIQFLPAERQPVTAVALKGSQTWNLLQSTTLEARVGDLDAAVRVERDAALTNFAPTLVLNADGDGDFASEAHLELGPSLNVTKNGTGDLFLYVARSGKSGFDGVLTLNGGDVHLNDGALAPIFTDEGDPIAPSLVINGGSLFIGGKTTVSQITNNRGSSFVVRPETLAYGAAFVFAPLVATPMTFTGILGDEAADEGVPGAALAAEKIGFGTLNLSTANTFSGGFSLRAGTLIVGASSILNTGTEAITAISTGPLGTGAFAITTGATFVSGVSNGVVLHNPLLFSNEVGADGTAIPAADEIGIFNFTGKASFLSTVGIQDNNQSSFGYVDLRIAENGVVTFDPTTSQADVGAFTTSLIKSGSGKLILGGSFDYGGSNVWVKQGTLAVAKPLGLGSAQTIVIGNTTGSAELQLGSGWLEATDLTGVTGGILGRGIIGSDGTWTSGTLRFTDMSLRFLSTGTLSVESGVTLQVGTLAGGFTNTASTEPDPTLWLVGTGVVSSITKTGAGTLVSAKGATNISNINVTGGELRYSAGSTAISGTHTVALSSGTTLGLQGSPTARVDFSGVISGAGTLTAGGAGGSVGVSGANTYTGGTNIQSGTLEVNSSTALGASGNITFAGGTLKYGVAAADLSARFRSSGAASYSVDTNGNDLTYASALTGTGGLVKLGLGKLTLSAANTYTGTTSIEAGSVEIGTALGLQNSLVSLTGGSLSFGALSSATIGGLQGDQAVSLSSTSGALALTVAASGTASNFTGVFSGSGSLTKTGAGTLTLGGANTFTGNTTISAGTLKLANSTALGSSTVNYSAGLLDFGTLTTATVGGLSGSSDLALGSVAALTLNSNNASTVYSGVISGSGALVKAGSGTLTLTGANTFTGTTTVAAGTLSLGNGTTNGSVAGNIANNTALIINNASALSYSGVISSTGSFEKNGAGTLTLSGIQTYTGNTTIAAGVLALSGAATLASSAVTNNGKILFAGTGTASTYAGVIGGTGSLEKTGAGKLTLTGVNTYSGGTTIGSGAALELGDGVVTGSIGGNVSNAGTLGFNNLGDLTYAGTISGAGSLEKKSTGLLTLTKANTFSGTTTVTAGTLAFSGGGSVAGNIVNNSKVLFDVASATQTYAGIISSTGSLQKSGAGTLSLTGANTYTGVTTISAGTLSATSLPGSGPISNLGTLQLILGSNANFNSTVTGTGTTLLSSNSAVTLSLGGSASWDGNIQLGSNITLALANGAKILGNITINGGKLDVSNAGNNVFGGTTTLTLSSGILALGSTQQELQTANLTAGTISGNGTIFYGTNPTSTSARPDGATLEINTKTETIPDGVRLLAGRLGTLASAGTLAAGGTLQFIELKATNTGATLRIDQNAIAATSVLAIAGTAGSFNVSVDAPVTTALFGVERGITTTFGSPGQLIGGTLENAGVVDFSGTSKNLNAISLQGGTLRNGTLAAGLLNAGSGTVSTKLAAGFGPIVKSGSGTLALNGASESYNNLLTVSAGTVSLGSATALGTAGKVALSDSSVLQVNGNAVTIGSLTGSGTIENASTTAGGITFDFASDATYAGTLRNGVVSSGTAGSLAFTKAGVGTLTLVGSNSYTGGTTVQNGTLVVGLDLPTGGALTVTGGALDLNSKNLSSGTLSLLGGFVGNGTLSATSYALQGGTVSANLTGTAALTKTGSGTTTLAAANTFTGATTVSAGTLRLANASALANSAVNYSAGLLDFGTLTSATLGGLSGSSNLGLASVNALTLGGNNLSTTYSGAISGAGALVKAGTGTFTLTGANVYDGTTTVNAGTLSLGNGTTNGSVAGNVVNNAALIFNNTTAQTYAGTISSNGTVEKKGAGTLTLSGIHTYTGSTTVTAGTLSLSGAGMVASNIANASKVQFAGNGTDSVYGGVISGAGSVEKTGAGKLTLTGSNTYSGGTTVGTGAALELGNGVLTGSIGGNITNAGTVSFNNADTLVYAGVVSSTGALQKNGAGTLSLTGAHTYTGGTNVSGGTLAFTNGGSVQGNIINTAKVLFDVLSAQSYAGIISSTGSLTKTGLGTLTLSGSNIYSGGTTIAAGTLASTFLPGSGPIANNGTFRLTLGANASYNSTVTGTGTTILSSSTAVTLALGGAASWDGNIQLGTNVTLSLVTGAKILGNITINGGKLDVSEAGNNVFGAATNLTLTTGTFVLGTTQQEIQFANLNGGTITGSGIIYYGELGASGTGGSSRPNGAILDINTKTEPITNGVRLLAGRLGDLASAGTLQFIELSAQNPGATLRINELAIANTSVVALAGTAGGFNVSLDAQLVTPLFDVQQGITTTVSSGGTLTVGTFKVGGTVDFSGLAKDVNLVSLEGGTLRNGTLSSGTLNATAGTVSTTLGSTFGEITKSGTGTLALNAASETYNNILTIGGGTVAMGSGTALGSSAKVALAAPGVLQVNGNSVTVGSITGTGVIENASTTAGGVVFDLASPVTYGGSLQNGAPASGVAAALSVTKSGTGSLTLTGTNSYTGGTTVQNGTLVIGSNLPATGAVTVSGGSLDLGAKSLASGLFTQSAGTVGNGTLSASAYSVLAGTVDATLAGTGALNKTGSGTVTLNAANTYSGGTTVSLGKLLLGGSGALSTTGVLTVNGGSLDLGGLSQTTGVATLSSGSILNGTLSATGGYIMTNSGSIGAVLAGAGALTKTGSGTVTLNALNTYSGLTSVNEGRLVVASVSAALPTGAQIAVGGGTLDFGGNTQVATNVTLSAGSISNGTLVATSYGVQSGVVGATLGGTGALTKTGAGTVLLNSGNTYTGGTTVTLGRLTLGTGGSLASTGAVTLNGGTLDLGGKSQVSGGFTLTSGALESGTLTASSFSVQSGSVSATLAGAGALSKSGTGTVTLNAANTYTGGTTVSLGKLALGSAGSLSNTGLLAVSGGTLDLGGKSQTAGATTLTAGALINGTLNSTGYSLQDGLVSATLGSTGKVTKSGTGTVTLTAANSYTGGTDLTDGTLVMSNKDAFSSGTVNFTGGTLSFSGITSATFGALAGTRDIALTNTASAGVALTVGNSTSTVYSGVLSGSGSLNKTGTGTLALSTASTYTGSTTVSAGTLSAVNLFTGAGVIVNNSILNVSLTSNGAFNGTLSGTGTTFLTNNSGGTITLTLGTSAFLDGGLTIGSGIILNVADTGKNVFGDAIKLTLNGTAALQIGNTTQEISTLNVDVAGGASVLGTGGKILYGTLPSDIIDANNTVIAGTVSGVTFEVLTRYTTTGSGTLTVTAGKTGKAVTLASTAGFNLNTLILEPDLATTKVRIDTGTIAAGGVTAQTGSLQATGQVFLDAAVTAPFFRIGSGISATITQEGSIVGGSIANSGTLILSVTGADKTVANVISGSGALRKTDAGVATLSGPNTYTGKTTLAGGILAATTASSFGTGRIEFSGGTLRYANTLTTDFSSRFDEVATGQFASVDVAANNVTFATGLQGAGGLSKSGVGTLTLTGTNTLSGALQVDAGTLQVGAGGTVGSVSANAVVGSGATLRFNRSDDVTYSGAVSGAGSVAQSGEGTLGLAGANTFSGGLSLNSGTLLLASAGAASNAGTIKFNGGALKFSAANTTDYSSRFAASAGQTYKLDTNGQNVTFGSVFGGANEALNKLGLGTLTLAANNTYSGATTVNAGTLEFVGNQSGTSAVTVNAGQLKYTLGNGQAAAGSVSLAKDTAATFSVTGGTATFSGVTSGSGAFRKDGAGNLNLTASQTVAGGVTVNAGTLTLGSALSTGVKLGGVLTLNTGSTLDAVYGAFDANTTLAFNGGTLKLGGTISIDTVDFGTGGTVTSTVGDISVFVKVLRGTNTLVAPNVTFLTKTTDANGNVVISGGLKGPITSDLGTSELNLTGAGGALVTLAVDGGLNLDKFTTAQGVNLDITRPVQASGEVTLSGGTLRLSDSLRSTGGTVTFAAGQTVNVSGSGKISAPILNVKGGSTLSVESDTVGALDGAKILILGTSVTDGTLRVGGGTGTFTIAQDQTLKGSGTIQGNVTLSGSNSVLNGGNSPGTIHIGGTLNLVSGNVILEVGATAQDQIAVGGTVVLGNGTLKPSLLLVNYDGSLAAGKTLQPLFIDAGSLAVTPTLSGGTITTQTGGFGSIEFARTNLAGVVMRSAMYALDPTTNGGTLVTRKTFADPAGYGAGLSGNTLPFAKAVDTRIRQIALNGGTISSSGSVVGGLAANQGLLELGEGTTLAQAVANIPLQLAAANPAGYAELSSLGFRRLTDIHQGVADRLQSLRAGALPMTEDGLAAWTTAYGSSQKRDGNRTLGTAGYSSFNFGELIGVEKHIGPLALGLTAAAGRTQADFDVTTGKVSTDSLHAGLYAMIPLGPVFLDTGFVVGSADTTVRRTISAPGLIAREGRMSVSGMEWQWQAGAALPLSSDGVLTLTPSARLIVQGVSQDAGAESEMAGLEVKTAKQSATTILHQTGLEIGRKLKVASRPALLSLNLDWIHNYDPNGRALDIALSGNGAASFSARGANTGADAVRVSGAFDILVTDRTSLRLSVDHQVQSKLSTTRGAVSVGISF
jgi:autotransporter-associated beta strand protein